jgi:hypothetical protein
MINEKAYRSDELRRVDEMITTLETVDFAGPYDDRRPLAAMRSWVETRRIELEAEDGNT